MGLPLVPHRLSYTDYNDTVSSMRRISCAVLNMIE